MAEPAASTSGKRYPAIDLARIVAASAVVLYHFGFYYGIPDTGSGPLPFPELSRVARYGHLGVQLFFMISGFLIVQTAARKSVRTFGLARVKRLYPAYLVCCALTFVTYRLVDAPLQGNAALTWRDLGYNLTMLNGVIDAFRGVSPRYVDGSYWTLAVEWLFYFIVATLIATRQLSRIEPTLWTWMVVSTVAWMSPYALFRTLTLAPWAAFFIAGAAFFRGHSEGWTPGRIALVTVSVVLALVQVTMQNDELARGFDTTFHTAAAVAITVAMFAFFVALPRLNSITRVVPAKAVLVLGAMSYPIYLLHFHLGAIAFRALWGRVAPFDVLVALLAGVFALAYVVHRWAEQPAWRLLHRRSA